MNLPFFKEKLTPKTPRDYIFAIEINSSYVKSSIWTVVNGKTQVLATGPSISWDSVSAESLATSCDESLSVSTRKLDATGKIQPEKVLFGLPINWIVDEKILPEHLKQLKHLTRELSLKAVGFVVTPQAIVKFIHSKEGVPPTAILAEINSSSIHMALIRLGKITFFETIHRSGQLGHDLAEGLSRFSGENMLPSRMLLCGHGQNLEVYRQEILSFPWQAPQHKLPFLHFPKVEVLAEDFSIQSISHAGGDEVAQAMGLISPQEDPELSDSVNVGLEANPEEFGFYRDTDTAELKDDLLTPSLTKPRPESKKKLPSIPHFNFIHLRLPRFFYPIILIAISIIAIPFWFIWNKLTAEIVLTFTPETREYEFELIADPGITMLDPESGLLPAENIFVTESAKKTQTTTGSKIVGDKAIGEVTIINGTPVSRLFVAGTVLTSPSGLQFILDTSVQVASASGTADPNSYQPGKANAKVTASTIGSDSNLSAGTQFRIDSFSSLDFVARNDTAFTGGSSRQVQAVSKEDTSNLRSELVESLTESAKLVLLSKQGESQLVIPDSVIVKVDKELLNYQVDEVADSVEMELIVEASGLSILKSDLEQLVSDRISNETPSDFYQYQPVDYEFGIKSIEGDIAQVVVNATTHLLPKVDYEQLKQEIVGKKVTSAQSYLQSLKNILEIKINIRPGIFSWFGFLPHVKQNINFSTNPL